MGAYVWEMYSTPTADTLVALSISLVWFYGIVIGVYDRYIAVSSDLCMVALGIRA